MRCFVFIGTLFPFLMTALGAAVVFLMGNRSGEAARRACLGFAAGVMSAAAVFSLLLPAEELFREAGVSAGIWLPVFFLAGAGVVLLLSRVIFRGGEAAMMAAITLHNIPEGMAVGVALAGGAAAGAAVSLGIGLQNLPEGAAIALPLRQSGMSRKRSFLLGALSGAVEPAAALLAMGLLSAAKPMMPALMAISAGAMIWVVFAEILPECGKERIGAIWAAVGFALMMAMDVGMG